MKSQDVLLRAAALEAYRRFQVKQSLRAELFPEQLAVVDDLSGRIALSCSRRAGKSELLARLIAMALIDAGPNETVVFCARTLAVARKIIWQLLTGIIARHKLPWKATEHTGTITTPAGAVMVLVGVDDIASVEKVRGSKFRLAVCDEAATYQTYLERLVIDCLSPGTKDFDPPGRIILAGTPGYVCAGYWFDAAARSIKDGGLAAYSRHWWTLRNNPHIPNVDAALAQERRDNGWTEESPQYRREYIGEWVPQTDALVYNYNRERNATADLPEKFDPNTWLTTVGVDVGFVDDFAITVLGSPKHSRKIYALHSYSMAGLLAGEQADHIKHVCDRFKPTALVGDAGGQGKLVLAEFNARYGTQSGYYIRPAEKTGKTGAIGLLNSDLRSGEFQIYTPEAMGLAEEMQTLPWKNDDREAEHPSFPNHRCDSNLYAWRAHKAHFATPAPKELTEEERLTEARRERQRKARDEKGKAFF